MRRIIRLSVAFLLTLTVVLGIFATAHAREAVVTLKNGHKVTGEFVGETEDGIELRIAGIAASYARADIESIELKKTTEEEFRERRAKLADDDVANRLKLATWLYNNNAFALAQAEIDDLAARAPEDGSVKIWKSMVDDKIRRMAEAKAAAPVEPAPVAPVMPAATPAEPASETGTQSKLPSKLLTPEQINLLKVYMIEPTDKPAVTVPNEVMQKLFTQYSDEPEIPRGLQARNRMLGMQGYEKLALLFKVRARDLYPEVTVKDDPAQVKEFRSSIHQTYVMNYCGTAKCHGGEAAGNFFLFLKNPLNADDVVYTNFHIVRNWEDARGFMVDVERPTRSYLLQYGMQRESAATPHPDVRGWTPQIRTTDSREYKRVHDWIRTLGLEQQFPVKIDYELPKVPKPEGATEAAESAPATN
jgi:hypothetical protein